MHVAKTLCLPVRIDVVLPIGQEYNTFRQILKAYKYRLKPTELQASQLESFVGHCRFVWNKCWQMNVARLKNKQCIMYYQEMDFFSKLWKSSVRAHRA